MIKSENIIDREFVATGVNQAVCVTHSLCYSLFCRNWTADEQTETAKQASLSLAKRLPPPHPPLLPLFICPVFFIFRTIRVWPTFSSLAPLVSGQSVECFAGFTSCSQLPGVISVVFGVENKAVDKLKYLNICMFLYISVTSVFLWLLSVY